MLISTPRGWGRGRTRSTRYRDVCLPLRGTRLATGGLLEALERDAAEHQLVAHQAVGAVGLRGRQGRAVLAEHVDRLGEAVVERVARGAHLVGPHACTRRGPWARTRSES